MTTAVESEVGLGSSIFRAIPEDSSISGQNDEENAVDAEVIVKND